jgi:acetyltransferase-like isoleucine patch superfamily enzyme
MRNTRETRRVVGTVEYSIKSGSGGMALKKLDGFFLLFRTLRCRRALRRWGIKFSNSLADFPSETVLDMEENVSLGAVKFGFRHLSIGAHSYLRSGGELMNVSRIGRFCSVANGAILGHNKGHTLDWVTTHPFAFGPPPWPRGSPARIGHDVWIGRDAVIFEGVSVGTGAAIAMRAVVTKDVPPYAIVAGVPARVVKYRFPPPEFPSVIQALVASRWWEHDPEKLGALPINDPEKFLLALNGALPKRIYDCVRLSRAGHERIRPLEWGE